MFYFIKTLISKTEFKLDDDDDDDDHHHHHHIKLTHSP